MKWFSLSIILFATSLAFSQTVDEKIKALETQTIALDEQKEQLLIEINELKLERVRADITKVGLPELKAGEELIVHTAMSLVYAEQHEQAKWVSHIITADIIDGKGKRSNNFRKDPLVKTESASEKDYF